MSGNSEEFFGTTIHNAVKILKLCTGEEILATVTEYPECYTVHHPLAMIIGPNGQIGTMPWMMYSKAAEEGVTIEKANVLFVVDPKQELEDSYKNALSPIATPSKKILLAE